MNAQQTILVVDDDPNVLEVLNARLLSAGYDVQKASDAAEAINLLDKKKPHLVVSDVKMPGMDGMALFNKIQDLHPGMPVIFLTAYANVSEAVHAVKAGAVDYLEKPFDGHELLKKIEETLNACQLDDVPDHDAPELEGDFYWGRSRAMKHLHDVVQRVARSEVNVMITGESGVGKERIADLIHNRGARKAQPFVVVDCGSTANGLLETELFGHAKGSFTHAIRDKKGLIEAADQGTLFLDEAGNISGEMQTRLLRFLEERKVRRVGTLDAVSVDCRVISATNSDLGEAINKGEFRQDLYYRLRGVTIKIPPLRERKRDIPKLARFFVDAYCKAYGIEKIALPQETIDCLCDQTWPGNVRELKNILEAGIVLCRDSVLRPDDLQFCDFTPGSAANGLKTESFSIEESERDTIVRALKRTGGVQKQAADLMGISRRAIHYKIKKYGINIAQIR
ncbi:MAG: sigma-54 dependent transcriptional regulator [Desulfobacterales bacterium]|nr:sigma-54 dependent transcriptional regulator [Desulfobacterales bacterium]